MGIKNSQILAIIKNIQNLDLEKKLDPIKAQLDLINQRIKSIRYVNSERLLEITSNIEKDFEKYFQELVNIENKLQSNLNENYDLFVKVGEEIQQKIWHKMDIRQHQKMLNNNLISDFEFDHFFNQASMTISWTRASMIIGSHNSGMIRALLGSEPIYCVELYHEYIDYQRQFLNDQEIKFYHFDQLNLLPKNGIGTLIIWDHLPFLCLREIESLIKKISNFMLPGGHLLFNYNDCATVEGLKKFENHEMTYMTKSILEKICQNYDLVLKHQYSSSKENFHFMIFQMPGEFNSIKRHPAIYRIAKL